MTWRVGVDSGGTFTDICIFDDTSGRLEIWKVPSTPSDPSEAISRGVAEGLELVSADAGDLAFFGHGTTVGTNALIQGRGAHTGLITTDGFRDLLEIGRQKRPDLYDIQVDKPQVLVSRDLRIEVPERVRHDGSIELPLDEDAVRQAVRTLKNAGVAAIAVAFLYSFARNDHEQTVCRLIAEEFPEAFVSISHEVAPEFREYERLSTAVVNAYLGPVMEGYIRRLASRLEQLGLKVKPHLTQSNGGVMSFEAAAQIPVRTILSGPSTGVVAAQAIGKASGYDNLITLDMGGTSSDVALLSEGRCKLANEAIVHGYPIRVPMLDIHTVGAGGGSIAYVDNGGLLKVGPRSAGAEPGPACYGRGNDEPTVTDANVVLHMLNPTYLLGGRMAIRHDLAKAAIARVADRIGLDVMETAQGILSVVTANMAKAIRVISVQRGYDPRDYALVAFGGAGPLHATRLAQELEMTRVIVPRTPGIMCATGLLLTDLRADFTVTNLCTISPEAVATVVAAIKELKAHATRWFEKEEVAEDDRNVTFTVDMRYAGQNYEIAVPLPDGAIDASTLRRLAEKFAEAHNRLYGFTADDDAVQFVAFRVEAAASTPKASFQPRSHAGTASDHAVMGARDIWLAEEGGWKSCQLYDRAKLDCGNDVVGPAIIEQMDATTVVLPGWVARVDPYLNLVVEVI